jgi:protein phosphatase 1D
MEDCYKIRFQRDTSINLDTNNNKNNCNAQQSNNNSDVLFSYFAIFDGHGGKEAAQYCKDKLFWSVIESDDFWSDDDSKILNAIREGFVTTHMNMWDELPNWPKTASGLPSTSGSTATVLFIKKSKAYVGHVGDSGLVIGYTKSMTTKAASLSTPWYGKKLTRDHKPEDPIELKRIQSLGGSVMTKSGVNRVVWNRPVFNSNSCSSLINSTSINTLPSNNKPHLTSSASIPYQMNYLRNQSNVPTERIPFLAVARSLGDLWSYEIKHDDFLVSPVPDVFAFDLDPRIHKCLILATDGLWNVLRSSESVELARQTDKETEQLVNRTMQSNKNSMNSQNSNGSGSNNGAQPFVNPSQRLVNTAIQRCSEKMIRADNTTCITIMLDQPDDLDLEETLNRTSFDRLISNNQSKKFH